MRRQMSHLQIVVEQVIVRSDQVEKPLASLWMLTLWILGSKKYSRVKIDNEKIKLWVA